VHTFPEKLLIAECIHYSRPRNYFNLNESSSAVSVVKERMGKEHKCTVLPSSNPSSYIADQELSWFLMPGCIYCPRKTKVGMCIRGTHKYIHDFTHILVLIYF
jgi:hypothetical protein